MPSQRSDPSPTSVGASIPIPAGGCVGACGGTCVAACDSACVWTCVWTCESGCDRPCPGAGEGFCDDACACEIERLGLGRGARLDVWLDAMRRVFPDVRAGDRIAGVYRPGSGASFFLNGRSLGSIDDPEFASAFFSIWLDARSAAPDLRAALLPDAGGRRRESM